MLLNLGCPACGRIARPDQYSFRLRPVWEEGGSYRRGEARVIQLDGKIGRLAVLAVLLPGSADFCSAGIVAVIGGFLIGLCLVWNELGTMTLIVIVRMVPVHFPSFRVNDPICAMSGLSFRAGMGVKGFARMFDPGIGPKEHFKHGGDQHFGLLLRAIGLMVKCRIVGKHRCEWSVCKI